MVTAENSNCAGYQLDSVTAFFCSMRGQTLLSAQSISRASQMQNIHVPVFQFYMTVCTCLNFGNGAMYANRKHNIQKGREIHRTPYHDNVFWEDFEKCGAAATLKKILFMLSCPFW